MQLKLKKRYESGAIVAFPERMFCFEMHQIVEAHWRCSDIQASMQQSSCRKSAKFPPFIINYTTSEVSDAIEADRDTSQGLL